YNLKPNNVVLSRDVPEYNQLFKEFNNGTHKLKYSAGGSTHNTLRTITWFLQQPNVTTYIGCIGNDNFGKILKEQATKENITIFYEETSTSNTGTCLVLITDNARSMVTNHGAANHFTIEYLNNSQSYHYIEKAKIFYVPGFFLVTFPEVFMYLCEHAHKTNKIMAINLSAEYICENFGHLLLNFIPYIDYLFGNEEEVRCFAQFHMKMTDKPLDIIVKSLQELLTKKEGGTVIITRGVNPILLATKDEIKQFNVKKPLKIVDTNGCGDAFVGGFLAYLSLEKAPDECVRAGAYCAYESLHQTGCTFPDKVSFDPSS
ncbi:unnamed protein product, partial [Didymodactylos carnosus]